MALPEYGLSTVFVVSLVSATLLPLGSEPAVFGLVKLSPELFWPAVVVATVGNTIGGAITWWMGYGAEVAYEHMIAQACVYKPVRIATRLGVFGQVLHAFAPRIAQIVMNTSFRMFPDSEAARGDKGEKPKLSAEAMALQQMMRGIHF